MIIVLSLVGCVKKIIYRLPHEYQPQPGLISHRYFHSLGQSYRYFAKWIYPAQPTKVLIHAVQHHPTRPDILHVDFYQVRMTEKLETDIELNLIGESAAVKEMGGILVRSMDKVKVSCLPGDLVHSIDVDIAALKTFEDRIRVADIVAPKGITIMENPEEIVATVSQPRTEAELASLNEEVKVDVANVEVEKKGKTDEEAAAEGDAAKE
jgi:large subunit ribosomal protein L25